MLLSARARAKKAGLPFNITEDDFEIPTFCPVLGLKLERADTGRGGNPRAPSLDRIKPELGYVKGNVMVISFKANTLKNNGTPDELRRIASFYTKLENECPSSPKTISATGPNGSPETTASVSPKSKTTMTNSPSLLRRHSLGNVALIDGDIIAYKASFGNEEVIDWGDGVINIETNLPEAERTVAHLINGIAEKLNTDKIIIVLSDDERNFRKALYADYKANRDYRRKPLALRHIKKHLATKYTSKRKDGLEADDVLGIMATHPKMFKGQKPIIVTIDKDLLQIPARHYNQDKDVKRMVSEPQGDLQFYTQVLTGDAVDNFPGCPGIGPVRAAKVLAEDGEPWAKIVTAYEHAGLKEEDALLQARVARILRYSDYDTKRKEPILWTPQR